MIEYVFVIAVIKMEMEENCTMRPCATDFSIAAIMSRHGRARTSRCRDRDPPDPMSPLGKSSSRHNAGLRVFSENSMGFRSGYLRGMNLLVFVF